MHGSLQEMCCSFWKIYRPTSLSDEIEILFNMGQFAPQKKIEIFEAEPLL
jgi:hypothetical protein